MPNTYVDYTGDNTTTSFAFPFPYLDDTHVVVQLDTVALAGGKFVDQTVTTHYTIQTSPSAAIIFVTAPATGDRIRIKRDSASDTALVDFENGSVLTEVELDRAYLHNLYLNEEIEEGSGKNTMTKDPVDGHYDADLAKIKNLADPTNPQDAVTKNYADTTFVDVAGDSMTGNLAMGANNITGASSVQGLALTDPAANDHAANKKYVDQQDALQVTKTGDSMSGALDLGSNKITSLDTPTVASDAANKSYVDSNIASTLATGVAGGLIDTVNIADDAITGDKIADNAIGTNHLGVDVIVAEDIANNAITVAELADNAVTAAKISATDTDFCVDTNGRVGIGVSPPLSPLHVVGDARFNGNVIVGPDLRGFIAEKSEGLTGTAVAVGGTVDITVAGDSSFQGFLTVSSIHPQDATIRTQTTFSVFGRSNQSPAAPSFTATIITSVDGSNPMQFSITSTTNGVITFTNNHATLTSAVTMMYFGASGF